MNDAMHELIRLKAIAIYHEHGIIKAHAYLSKNGWTTNEIVELFEAYEDVWEQVRNGNLN
jgi:hypothetical protein